MPRVSGMGSGVLIDGRGYILTNHHVVDQVQGIVVQLFDGTTYPARVLQFDRGDGSRDPQGRSRTTRWRRSRSARRRISWSVRPSSRSAMLTDTRTRFRSAS